MKRLALCIVFLGLFLPIATVSAMTTITFDSLNDGEIFSSYTESGVTFTELFGGDLVTQPGPVGGVGDGSLGIRGFLDPLQPIRADIAGGATFVSVDLGDFNVDGELLFLEVFDSSDALLDFASLQNDPTFEGLQRLSVSNPNISYAVFGAIDSNFISSVLADNFTYTAASVPIPSTLLFFGLGFAGFAAWRKRADKQQLN